MRALVTGGAGFIGHHLVAALLDGGHDVSIIDDLSTGFRERIQPFETTVDFHEGDIRDAGALDVACAGVDVIFHLAAVPSVARSVRDPRLSHDVNTTGTVEVMLAAARAKVLRVVFSSSSSVYGDNPTLPRREDDVPRPVSPYAVSKHAAEQYVRVLGTLHGVETVVLRYFNIFGPGQDPDSEYAAVIPRFILAALHRRNPIIFGDGRQSRDFTYVENAVRANLLAANAHVLAPLTVNVGSGTRYSLLDLISTIERTLGHACVPTFAAARPGDVTHSLADITQAERHLGYEVGVPFEEGIGRTIAWYRDRHAL